MAWRICSSEAPGRANPTLSPIVAGEQKWFLVHEAELAAQRRERHVAQVMTVNQDAPLHGVVEPGDEFGDRRLAGPGRPDEGDSPHRL